MNILVTGGTGFIGSHVTLMLLNLGHRVFIIDSLINSNIEVIDRLNKLSKNRPFFFKGDLRNIDDINFLFKKTKSNKESIDAVFHFAGLKSINESVQNPFSYWENNVLATYNLLKIMRENNCKNIIFSSSATIYGDQYKSPISEDNFPNPINPYGFTKLSVENLLLNIFSNKEENWNIAILRYFNPAGNHFSGMIGENPKGLPANLFPMICKVAAGEIDKLTIHGNDWTTIDGSGVRDYIHVMDLADGHIAALNKIVKNDKSYLILNLGTGKGTSVFEMINVFEKVNNVKINFEIGERRICDTAEVYADCSKAREIINWSTSRSLEDICRDGWKWYKSKLSF